MLSKSLIKRLLSKRFLILLLALLGLLATLIFVEELDDTVDVQRTDRVTISPPVTVVTTRPETVNMIVSVQSEVRPQWQLELKTEVGGKVNRISEKLFSGARLQAGDVLFEIDATRYVAELADARHALHQRQLELLQAQYQSQVAAQQFKSMDQKAPNELALNLPQVEIAKAAVNSAQAAVKVAQHRLEQTQVRAPFNGYLLSHQLSPEQMILAGESVATMLGDDTLKLSVRVNRSQWQQLNHPLAEQKVTLHSQSGAYVGDAIVKGAGGYLDSATRHYLIHLTTPSNQVSAIPGEYLQVRFKGKAVKSALTIPASAITPEGRFWWVDDNNLLNRSPALVLDRVGSFVVVEAVNTDQASYAVVVTPLSSYLLKQKVTPIENDHAQAQAPTKNGATL